MKEELIKYVMEKADKQYSDDFPIPCIEDWIREFFDQFQPERSKREDCNCPDRYLLNGTYMGKYCRCGALNSMET